MKAAIVLSAALAGSAAAAAQEMPPGADAWVVRVTTTGGFTGAGPGDYTATSAGVIVCARVACIDKLPDDLLRQLSSLVVAAERGSWTVPKGPACSDCYRIRLVLVRREAGDALRTYTAEWDEPVNTPQDVGGLYRGLVRALRPADGSRR